MCCRDSDEYKKVQIYLTVFVSNSSHCSDRDYDQMEDIAIT